MAKRKFTHLKLRVHASDSPAMKKPDADRARAFDAGWQCEVEGRPLALCIGFVEAQGWLAARAARHARHFAINGYDQGEK